MNFFGLQIQTHFSFREYNPADLSALQNALRQDKRIVISLVAHEASILEKGLEDIFYKDLGGFLSRHGTELIVFDVSSSHFSQRKLLKFVQDCRKQEREVYVSFCEARVDDIISFCEADCMHGIGLDCENIDATPVLENLKKAPLLQHLHLIEPGTFELESLVRVMTPTIKELSFVTKDCMILEDFLTNLKETDMFVDGIHLESGNLIPFKISNLIGLLNDRRIFPSLIKSIKDGVLTEFSRSKLMFVGQGRAGKTSTINSLMERDINGETPSTEVLFCQNQIEFVEENGAYVWVSRGITDQSFSNDLVQVYCKERLNKSFHLPAEETVSSASTTRLAPVSFRTIPQEAVTRVEHPTTTRMKAKGKYFQSIKSSFSNLHYKASRIFRKDILDEPSVADETISRTDISSRDEIPVVMNTVGLVKSKLTREMGARLSEIAGIVDRNALNVKRSLSIWDFGGQEVFYTVHHLFLTNNGVYCVTFDLMMMLKNRQAEVENLQFWLTSILLYSPKAAIIFVATHVENVAVNEIIEIDRNVFKMLLEQEEFLQLAIFQNDEQRLSFFLIENSKRDDQSKEQVECLRKAITTAVVETADNLAHYSRSVPLSWIYFMDSIARENIATIQLDYAYAKGEVLGLDNSQVDQAFALYNDFGAILSFKEYADNEVDNDVASPLKQIIILKPQWLMDVLKTFIYDKRVHHQRSFKQHTREYEMKGILSHTLLLKLLNKFSKDEQMFLIDLFRRMLLLSEYSFDESDSEEKYSKWFVPSMCASTQLPPGLAEVEADNNLLTIMINTEKRQPKGFYERIVCLMLRHSNAMEGSNKPHLTNVHSYVDLYDIAVYISKVDAYTVAFRMENVVSLKMQLKFILEKLQVVLRELRKDKLGHALKPFLVLHGQGMARCKLIKLKTALKKNVEVVQTLDRRNRPIEIFSTFVTILKEDTKRPLRQRIRQSIRRGIKIFDCFIAHEWGLEETGFETHQKAILLKEILTKQGFNVWLDKDNLRRNVGKDIVAGLENSRVTIVLLTKRYFQRCENDDTNCWKEFNYATSKGAHTIIPLVYDREMLEPSNWFGRVKYHLSDIVFCDFTSDEAMQRNLPKVKQRIENSLKISKRKHPELVMRQDGEA